MRFVEMPEDVIDVWNKTVMPEFEVFLSDTNGGVGAEFWFDRGFLERGSDRCWVD
jgi:hypothetical protein